jgi:hypothetical protein
MIVISGTPRAFERFLRQQGISVSRSQRIVAEMKKTDLLRIEDERAGLLHKTAAILGWSCRKRRDSASRPVGMEAKSLRRDSVTDQHQSGRDLEQEA